ncbi:MAG: gamma-glutamyltransferase family protein [Acidobacteria bacterium]|nr:gamma-glutamyltransferase family protein [Acidobacteriota bacterium]
MKRRPILLLLSLTLPLAFNQATDRTHGRSMVIARGGIVSTSQVLASQAGAAILAQGGGAVDAAIAANAVLGVVEPMMCGIGGDLFVMYRDAKTGQITGLNSSGPAPRAMTIEALQAKGLEKMAATGIHSATVPGCVRGWEAMHKKYGKLPWSTLFKTAIHLSADGFPMQEMVGRVWESNLVRKDPEGVRVFYPNGKAPAIGDLYKNPGLARAMRIIADGGADSFYKGEIARAILAKSGQLGGLLSAADLASFEPEWVTPISTTYRGWRVYELPPNGQGLAALSMLNILENFTPAAPFSHAEFHRKIEAMKLAYADLKFVGDTRLVKVPTQGMTSKSYAAQRAKLLNEDKANCAVEAGQPPTSSDTTYFTVVDGEGNIVSWIQSVSGLWASGVAVDGMGFHLHNRGGGFSFDKTRANALAPGKRPFHTIIPAIMEKDDLHIGFGIMSGANQPLAHAQFVSYLADHNMNLQAALEAPRFTKSRPTGCDVIIESRVGLDTLGALSAKGHQITIAQPYTARMGRGNAVMHNAKTKVNTAASDPRADGAAIPQPE